MLRAAYVRSKFVLSSFFQPFSLFFLFDVSVLSVAFSPRIFRFVNQLLFRDFFARSGALLPLVDSEHLNFLPYLSVKNRPRFSSYSRCQNLYWR